METNRGRLRAGRIGVGVGVGLEGCIDFRVFDIRRAMGGGMGGKVYGI